MSTDTKTKLLCDSCGGTLFDQGLDTLYCGACKRHIPRKAAELMNEQWFLDRMIEAENDIYPLSYPHPAEKRIREIDKELAELGYKSPNLDPDPCYGCGRPTDNPQGLCDECKDRTDIV